MGKIKSRASCPVWVDVSVPFGVSVNLLKTYDEPVELFSISERILEAFMKCFVGNPTPLIHNHRSECSTPNNTIMFNTRPHRGSLNQRC